MAFEYLSGHTNIVWDEITVISLIEQSHLDVPELVISSSLFWRKKQNKKTQ